MKNLLNTAKRLKKNSTFPAFMSKIITVIRRRASRKHIRLCFKNYETSS